MSPKLPVLSLAYLCVKLVSSRLIQVLSDDEGLNCEAARDYLSGVTYEVLQELLKNILNSTNLDASTRFNSLEVLLRNDVRKLETGMFPHSYYDKILQVIIQTGRGLQHVNLKGVWARDHPDLLCELIMKLKNLKVLIIPHMANDAILHCIAECKKLNTLDISGESSFTNNGLSSLNNENLQVLNIGNYGKKEVCEGNSDDAELISTTIFNLPNLKSIRTYSFTGQSLFFLHSSNICHITKLTYLHDTGTSNAVFDAILELCPFLESIYLDSPEEGVVLKLKQLRRLNCLKLTKPLNEELTEYILNSGSNIEILKINHNKLQALDLSNVAMGASRVHTLEFYQTSLSFTKPDVFFMFLINIEILYCDITDSCLKKVLENSPFLKRILVGCVVNFTDGDIFRLCAENDFDFLEELWLSCAKNLTITSVELLMGHCRNLKILGQMSEWDVTSEEVEFLRSILQLSNIDLTLLPLLLQ